MQKLIKLKLTKLGYSKKDYNRKGLMDWLDEKNDIVFITIPKLIKPDIHIRSTYKFLVPAITNYENYLKIKEKYGGLPIALEMFDIDYSEWLKSIKFYDFIEQHNITLFKKYWYIYSYNYNSVKKFDSESEKKSIKIKKIKI